MSIENEIMDVLRKYSEKDDEYINPNFLTAINEELKNYFNLEDERVDDWIISMFGW